MESPDIASILTRKTSAMLHIMGESSESTHSTENNNVLSQAFQGLKRRLSTVTMSSEDSDDIPSLGTALVLPLQTRDSASADNPEQNLSSSPSRTPTLSASLNDMSFNFPPEKTNTDRSSSPSIPTHAQRQRRRASMQDAIDHTKFNASLYERMASYQAQPFGSVEEENLGSINFSLLFNQEQGLLTIRLIQAQSIVSRQIGGNANPYIKICLLPNRRFQLQTKVHKNTLNPEIEEEFMFDVLPGELNRRALQMLIYDYDQFSQDECLGQVTLPLDQVDLGEGQVMLWKGISAYDKKREEEENHHGDLMVSISYLQTAERLTVVVVKARNLRSCEEAKNTSTFVKISLLGFGKRLKKKKTSTQRNTQNPTWNEAVVFNGVTREQLSSISLEFMVLTDSLLGGSDIMAKVVIGPDSADEERAHWKELKLGVSGCARWHKLHSP